MFVKPNISKRLSKLLIEKCPDRVTCFYRIFVNKDGLIYIFVSDLKRTNSYELDIFSHSGKYIYHSLINIPKEFSNIRNLVFKNNNLYCTAEDENREIKLIKFTITSPNI